jgi:hypothetical protein
VNKSSEILVGASAGLIVGIAMRLGLAFAWPSMTEEPAQPLTPVTATAPVHVNTVAAEIRQATSLPSAEARAAVEAGTVKYIIRGKAKSDETQVARILLDLGSVVLCRESENIRIWSSDRWQTIKSFEQLSGYAVGRAWEVANHDALGPAGAQLTSSAQTFLLMPAEQELRLIAAVEKVLPTPLIDHVRIEILVERTPGGHVRWTLQRAVRRDNTQLLPNSPLPI